MKLHLILAMMALSQAFDLDADLEERALIEKSTFRPQKHFNAGDEEIIPLDSSIIASLREVPSELHLCSGSFVRADVLVTTARCIYGKVPDHTYIHTFSKFQAGSGVVVPVIMFKAHPHFEMSPPLNNIGLVFAKFSLRKAYIHLLPLPWQNHRGSVTIYQWKFGNLNVVFSLHDMVIDIITNAKCSIILKEFIDCKYICVGNQLVHHGSMDQGLPMSGRNGNKTYILGLYNREGTDRFVNAEQYEKVYPHVDWIVFLLKKYKQAPYMKDENENKNSTIPPVVTK